MMQRCGNPETCAPWSYLSCIVNSGCVLFCDNSRIISHPVVWKVTAARNWYTYLLWRCKPSSFALSAFQEHLAGSGGGVLTTHGCGILKQTGSHKSLPLYCLAH